MTGAITPFITENGKTRNLRVIGVSRAIRVIEGE